MRGAALASGVALEALHALPDPTSAQRCHLVGKTNHSCSLLLWALEAVAEAEQPGVLRYQHNAHAGVTVPAGEALVCCAAVACCFAAAGCYFPTAFSLVTGGGGGLVRLWAVGSEGLVEVRAARFKSWERVT
jgi:hypothetical protein